MSNPHDMAYLKGYEDGCGSEKETMSYLYRQLAIARVTILATLIALAIMFAYYLKGAIRWDVSFSAQPSR